MTSRMFMGDTKMMNVLVVCLTEMVVLKKLKFVTAIANLRLLKSRHA